jgi:hypothetical protein
MTDPERQRIMLSLSDRRREAPSTAER